MLKTFPEFFRFGAATAAFQIEGAAREDGKGASIWDVFCATAGRTAGGDTGDVACDHYHRWREDIELLRRLNLRDYRLSISWPRVLPHGRGRINERGLGFYDRLIDGLCDAGIEPLVTVYHWDLPDDLQRELGGWACDDLPAIFADYAGVLFDRLGDRVRMWLTMNEPWVVVDAGYIHGVHPPGIRDRRMGYVAAHNLLRGHAYAVARYRGSRHGNGRISFALNTSYSFAASDSPADQAAAQRAMLGFGGWFGDPAVFGAYPAALRNRLGGLLPSFSEGDARLLRGSMDYIALNYYTSDVVRHVPGGGAMELEKLPQAGVATTAMGWPIRPDGLRELLGWLATRYAGLPIYITENGAAFEDRPDVRGFVQDEARIAYLREHLAAVADALAAGVDVRGYYVWSLLDNLEWAEGFAKRFGIVRCDHKTQKRTIKASGRWYGRLAATRRLEANNSLPAVSKGVSS